MKTPNAFPWFALSAALLLAGCADKTGLGGDNTPPKISRLWAESDTITIFESTTITVVARDDDGDRLTFQWDYDSGYIIGDGAKVYFAPAGCHSGVHTVTVTVLDGRGGSISRSLSIEVI